MSAVILNAEERHRVGLDDTPPAGDDIPRRDRAVAQLRVPPHSIDAESSVLGSLLLDNRSWDRVGDVLTEIDFYRYEHRLVFVAIGGLINANRPADVITVFEVLKTTGKADEVGGLAYLNSLAQFVSSAANVRRYAEIVRERSVLRQLVAASDEIATQAFNTQGRAVETILDEAEQRIFRIRANENASADEWETMDAGIQKVLNHIQGLVDGSIQPDYTQTGLKALDERLDGGMRGGELIVVGARPSMGKSAMGLTVAVNLAQRGLQVGMFSMEMPKKQVNTRAMALAGQVHLSKLKRPERLRDHDWPCITDAVEKLSRIPLHINDQSGLNINQVRAKSRSLYRRHGKLGLIVVDYLGLMPGTNPEINRAYQIEEITQGLKNLAKELDCPILLLVQLKRAAEERVNQMPQLSDLSDSSAVEKDADVIFFIHRAFKANPTLADEWRYYAKCSMAKVRDGEPGYFDLMYVGENLHFLDWPDTTPVPVGSGGVGRSKL
jgi:replicative DNA helicase